MAKVLCFFLIKYNLTGCCIVLFPFCNQKSNIKLYSTNYFQLVIFQVIAYCVLEDFHVMFKQPLFLFASILTEHNCDFKRFLK